jgi:hypothetical protein
MKLARVFCFLIILGSSSIAACAQTTIFDNFGSGHTSNNGVLWTVDGPTSGQDTLRYPAMGFMPGVTASLSQIDFAISYISGTTNSVTLSLSQNATGEPGTVIQSWTVTGLPNADGSFTNSFDTVLGSGETLTAGQLYWLVASAPSDTVDGWNYTTSADIGPLAWNYEDGLGWDPPITETQGAFDVLGAPSTVPEPGSLLLFGTGLLGIVGAARRKWLR